MFQLSYIFTCSLCVSDKVAVLREEKATSSGRGETAFGRTDTPCTAVNNNGTTVYTMIAWTWPWVGSIYGLGWVGLGRVKVFAAFRFSEWSGDSYTRFRTNMV